MKIKIKSYLSIIISFFFFYHLTAQEIRKGEFRNTQPQETFTPSFEIDGVDMPVKNIILMIGDGMGLAHVSAAMYANHGELTLTNLKTCGLVRTQSANKFTTDSAASGTAFSTGQKTKNGALGVDIDNNILPNLPEKLDKEGYISGIVTTDNLDGATPAAFFSHQPERGMSKEIWEDISTSKLTFFSAGSYEQFEDQQKSTRKAIKKQFTIISKPAMKAIKKAKRLGFLPLGKETASVNNNRGDYLPNTTQLAIDYLSSKKSQGFFLMVEGARIDKSAHSNDFQAVIREVLDFDKAIEVAIRFAEKEGNTLVIITADHETGALSLRDGQIDEGYVQGLFASNGHTPIMVPLFAFGPQSGKFTGVQENNDVGNKIYEILQNKK